jgi:hypothetical protein
MIAVTILTLGVVIVSTLTTAASRLAFTDEMLSESELTDLATRAAESLGMTSIREMKYTLMTRGSLFTMLGGGGDGGLSAREAPMFVAQFKGDIPELRMFGSFSAEEKFDSIIISLDARSGALYHNSAHHSANHSVDIMATYIDTGEGNISIPTPAPLKLDIETTAP